jgi:hypothetical protein
LPSLNLSPSKSVDITNIDNLEFRRLPTSAILIIAAIMSRQYQVRPENVLRRAQELIAVDQQSAALTVLHEHVTSKRSRNSPVSSLEPVMLLFVELCVDLRKGKSAKDGLYQYKNTTQNTNVGTIEVRLILSTHIEDVC